MVRLLMLHSQVCDCTETINAAMISPFSRSILFLFSLSHSTANDDTSTQQTTAKFKQVEQTTGYPAAWFFVAAVGLVTSILTLMGGVKLLVDLVGFLYPAYMSFKALESSSNEDTQWLTYWVVFSFVFITESIFSFVVKLIPFYYWLKAAGIVVRTHTCLRVYVFAVLLRVQRSSTNNNTRIVL